MIYHLGVYANFGQFLSRFSKVPPKNKAEFVHKNVLDLALENMWPEVGK